VPKPRHPSQLGQTYGARMATVFVADEQPAR
jgi:hypothetical protein